MKDTDGSENGHCLDSETRDKCKIPKALHRERVKGHKTKKKVTFTYLTSTGLVRLAVLFGNFPCALFVSHDSQNMYCGDDHINHKLISEP